MTTMDKIVTAEAWDAIADRYDDVVTPMANWRLGELALGHVDLAPGMRLLDVACGSGALSVPAARLGADVLGIDFAPNMVRRLRARARAEGLTNLDARVMDGHSLELEDDTFDVAASQFGVMLFPDLPRGLGEMVRVTRPGGKVMLIAFRSPEEAEFLTFFIAAVQAVVPGFTGPPPDRPLLPFQVADAEVLRRRMTEAGLSDVRIEPRVETLEFTSGDHMWDWMMGSNPIPGVLTADLTDEDRVEVRRVLEHMLRERAGGKLPATLTAGVHIAVGTK